MDNNKEQGHLVAKGRQATIDCWDPKFKAQKMQWSTDPAEVYVNFINTILLILFLLILSLKYISFQLESAAQNERQIVGSG